MNKILFCALILFSFPVFAADCQLPWGPVLKDGDSTIAWNYSHPPSTLSCRSEVRSCESGFLTGSFTFPSCSQPARLYWMWMN